MPEWIPLHVHSQYSILDATASIQEIAAKSKEFGLPAVALTDHGNLYGAVDFYKACKEVKIKPLLGVEFWVAPEGRFEKRKEYSAKTSFHLTLLAKNQVGYRNLSKLSSKGFLEGYYYHPRIDLALLKEHKEGLVCLSGCLNGPLAREILHKENTTLPFYQELFKDDFYLEIQRHTMSEEELKADGLAKESWVLQYYLDTMEKQEKIIQASRELAAKYGCKIVATQNSHYIERQDWRAHEILLNIQSGEPVEMVEKDSFGNVKQRVPNPKRRIFPSHAYHFRSPTEMAELFADIPEALHHTLEVAEKCQVDFDFKTKHYPVFTPPQEDCHLSAAAFLQKLCNEGIARRYTPERLQGVAKIYPGRNPLEVVQERLAYELSVIIPKEMSDYLLIVWDFIHWAKTHGIPMGPGRGSGAGSIVLYLIGVTDIEPLRFNLVFERFINPERISYPDIDVDICMDRRGEVINYTLNKYGKENVAQIITFGTMKAKMAIRDVGRVLNIPLSKVNEIAKLVPEELNITLEQALEKDPDLKRLYDSDEEAQRIIDSGKTLEGSIRNTGIHAAGIIISGEPLTEHIPIALAKDSEMPVTQYSMKPVEMVGMLKVDFLGLKTLTAIQNACNQVKDRYGKTIDWINLPLDDKPTFELLNQGKTLGVFQLESGGMQDLAHKLHLDKFEEIIAVGALYRPGPMDMIPSFINRKHGREQIEYDHPWMEEILAETYGIMVYQEQVMQIAQKLAGYSLGEGDVLRRAMGKKDAQEMARQRAKFQDGALAQGISASLAAEIFDKMEKFASYGFNKSHAAAYGYLSYVTGYLKANYPAEWLSALMTCDSHDLTKVAKFIREAHSMGIKTLPPDLNEAGAVFSATASGIRFAMGGIKGVGEGVVEAILEERKKGKFVSLWDFVRRIDPRKVGKKACESLIEAGALDFTGWDRDALLLSLNPIWETAAKEHRDKASGFLSLFALMGEETGAQFSQPPPVLNPTPLEKRLLKEKELLGFFLTSHPMDRYKHLIKRLSCASFLQVEEMAHDTVFRAAFLVESVQVRFASKTQRKFAILMVSDGFLTFELPIWSDLYEEKSHLMRENQLLFAVLQVDRKEEGLQLRCRWLDDLTLADEAMVAASDLAYDRAKAQAQRIQREPKKEAAAPPPKVDKERPAMLELTLDAARTRHSHILQLKELFQQHRGPSPIHITFHLEGRQVAHLDIDARWGVKITPTLKEALQKMTEITHQDF